jgi:antitoxin CcdA
MPDQKLMDSRPKPARRATNVTLPEDLQREAKALKVNISQACENGLAQAVQDAKRRQWLAENREAMEAYNAYVEKNGLLLAAYRQF